MHNDDKNKNGVDPVPESAILHANKVGMPTPKNSVAANKIGNKNINEREYGVQYGKDASCKNKDEKKLSDKKNEGDFSGDASEMRKAPGYNGSVPGVNTPDIRLPSSKKSADVSAPAFNPPVPNRAWTEMKKGMEIEGLSEDEKRDLYVGHDGFF